MSHNSAAVQPQRTETVSPEESEAVRTLLYSLVDDCGIRDRETLICRVQQVHHAFSHQLIDLLLEDVLGSDGASSGARPHRADISTQKGGIPRLPKVLMDIRDTVDEKLVRKSIRISDSLESPGIPPSEGGDYPAALTEHLKWCIGKNRDERGRRPASPMFHFVRHAQAHPALRSLTAEQALERITQVLEAITTDGECPWRSAFGESRGTCMTELEDLWDKITHLPGEDALESAVMRARRYPFMLPPDLTGKRKSPDYRIFLAVADQLQEDHPGGCILLPQKRLGDLLGVSQKTISIFSRWAKEDGFLKEITPYKPPAKGKGGKATEFIFDPSRGET